MIPNNELTPETKTKSPEQLIFKENLDISNEELNEYVNSAEAQADQKLEEVLTGEQDINQVAQNIGISSETVDEIKKEQKTTNQLDAVSTKAKRLNEVVKLAIKEIVAGGKGFLKAATLFSTLLIATENLEAQEKTTSNNENNKIEVDSTQEKKEVTPDSYDLSKMGKIDTTDLDGKKNLDPATIKRVINKSLMRGKVFRKIRDWNNRINVSIKKEDDLLQKKKLKDENSDSENIDNELANLQANFDELYKERKNISEEEKIIENGNLEYLPIELESSDLEYLKIAPELFKEIEQARNDVKTLIKSEKYLEKLKKEFGNLAYQHQQTRLSNIDLANYDLASMEEMKGLYSSFNTLGYFITDSNKIVLPYDVYDKYQKGKMYEIAFHEFSHEISNGNEGLSNKASQLLVESFSPQIFGDNINQYQSNPTERYVRLKALERDLNQLGIKNVDEEFTEEHYKKMKDLLPDGKFSKDAEEFIHFLKNYNTENGFKVLKQLFDEIAYMDNSNHNVKDIGFDEDSYNKKRTNS